MALISKVQIQRPHSVCAEGGSAAVMREEEGDSLDLHAWDTVKGSDFLADQDVVYKFVELAPKEIMQLDHWGIPWSRFPNGQDYAASLRGSQLSEMLHGAGQDRFLRSADSP